MAYRGKYRPKNISKYKGNYSNIIYRSLWELRFMKYCDISTSVISWSSEEIIIPYISPLDNKKHRYYPDFWVMYTDKDGKIEERLIEVKPKKETVVPILKENTRKYAMELKKWEVNKAKWESAIKYCEAKGWRFQILTEATLAR